jgi:hypothetical protein
MEIEGNHANIYVGCGITKDSCQRKNGRKSRNNQNEACIEFRKI